MTEDRGPRSTVGGLYRWGQTLLILLLESKGVRTEAAVRAGRSRHSTLKTWSGRDGRNPLSSSTAVRSQSE